MFSNKIWHKNPWFVYGVIERIQTVYGLGVENIESSFQIVLQKLDYAEVYCAVCIQFIDSIQGCTILFEYIPF